MDQSGSVNQCNFQKVKRWLRNIVRSFNIGKDEQDVGVVVYSSKGTSLLRIFKKNVAISLRLCAFRMACDKRNEFESTTICHAEY